MKKICNVLAVLISSLYLSSATAAVTVIDFDKASNTDPIVNGEIVDTQYNGVTITSVINNGGNGNEIYNRQVAFDTEHNSVQDGDLEFNNPSNDYNSGLTRTNNYSTLTKSDDDKDNYNSDYSYTALVIDGHNFGDTPGNILIMQNADRQGGCDTGICTNPDDENGSNPSGYFEFTFDFLVDIISLDTFDFEETSLLTAEFFDENDTLIPTSYVFSAMVDGGFKRQDISISGVKRLVLNLPGSGAIDNLAFRATEVPAPATLSIFALSLLFMARRARK